ncbi:transcriptional regulator, AraC family with amidase-like domain [Verrucomicrobium sp. GAS474]|uniref:GlxA family transcriptional regulator n=1 Tax=Verrucomicrobium sp. GAS474 TaxID=1882831 RepID=UPI00087DA399|nr:GlxA family transcriptional regulator [Verrucomicrobium sp. GAS474]SDT97167.1 transcriptional regulator, AraC family with amidase-like domain [Verrucomicrobium sp. GAS474]
MAVSSGTKRIVFFGLPPVREIDLIGAIDVFATANQLAGGKPLYELKVIAAEPVRGKRIAGMFGLSLSCDGDYRAFRGEIDTLLVPGGRGVEERKAAPAAIAWLRKAASRSRRVGSICTGTFLLAQAGLLDGKRAATHWAFAADLAKRYPKVGVDPEPIWIQDGNYYTSAGVTSGIDLSLALLEEDHGAALALDVARMMVVFLKRPGNQAQFSVSLAAQKTESKPLHELRVWMAEHLSADLSVEALARRVAMSPRNFQRVFAGEAGKPVARYVEELRIEAARRHLERTTQSLDEIAGRCGFKCADTMGRAFVRSLHATPGEYRSRFRSSGIGK